VIKGGKKVIVNDVVNNIY